MSGNQRETDQQNRQPSRDDFEDALADIFGEEETSEPAATAAPLLRPVRAPIEVRDEPAERLGPLPRREPPGATGPASPFGSLRQRSLLRIVFFGCLLVLGLPLACFFLLAVLGMLIPDSGSASFAPAISWLAIAAPGREWMLTADDDVERLESR